MSKENNTFDLTDAELLSIIDNIEIPDEEVKEEKKEEVKEEKKPKEIINTTNKSKKIANNNTNNNSNINKKFNNNSNKTNKYNNNNNSKNNKKTENLIPTQPKGAFAKANEEQEKKELIYFETEVEERNIQEEELHTEEMDEEMLNEQHDQSEQEYVLNDETVARNLTDERDIEVQVENEIQTIGEHRVEITENEGTINIEEGNNIRRDLNAMETIEINNNITGAGAMYLEILQIVNLLKNKSRIEDYTVDELALLLNQHVLVGKITSRPGPSNSTLYYIDLPYIDEIRSILCNRIYFYPKYMKMTERMNKGKKEILFAVQETIKLEFKNGIIMTISGVGANSNTNLDLSTSVKAAETDAIKRAFKNLGKLFGMSLYIESFRNKVKTISSAVSELNKIQLRNFYDLRKAILLNILMLLMKDWNEFIQFIEDNVQGDYLNEYKTSISLVKLTNITSVEEIVNLILIYLMNNNNINGYVITDQDRNRIVEEIRKIHQN